jgi:hypothetical protein
MTTESGSRLRELVERIRMEYLEMPGLSLTRTQARRLWNLDSTSCDAVFATLVHERFLTESRSGAYLKRDAL